MEWFRRMGTAMVETARRSSEDAFYRRWLVYYGPVGKEPPVGSESLECGVTTLGTALDTEKTRALVATRPIKALTRISEAFTPLANDPLMDLGPLLRAKNAQQMYEALDKTRETYFDEKRASRMLNMTLSPSGYVTTKDVKTGEELFKAYGFESWLVEIQPLLTVKTLPGYVYWAIDRGEWACKAPEYVHLYQTMRNHGTQRMHDLYGRCDFKTPAEFDALEVNTSCSVQTFSFQ